MTRALQELEDDAHRVLGAVELVDATTGARIRAPLQLRPADGAEAPRFVRNRSGLLVLWSHPGLGAHAAAFEAPPAEPALHSVALALQVWDPSGLYQPRGFTLRLPRDPDPRHAAQEDSLLRPQRVELFRGAAAPLGGNWTPLAVRVTESGSGDLLGGTLVEVRDAADAVLARGLTDWRGEALVPVAGVPVTTWGADDGAVVVHEIPATVHAVHVPALGTRLPAARAAGQLPALEPCPDPDLLGSHPQRVAATPQPVALAARRGARVALSIGLP